MREAWRHAFHRGLGTAVGWGLFGGGCVVFGLTLIPFTLAARRVWPGAEDLFRSAIHGFLGAYSRALPFARFEFEGGERFEADPREGPRPSLIVANHQSWLDPVVLLGHEPRLGGPAAAYLFRVPFLRTILRISGFYPADETGQLVRAAAAVEAVREQGGSVLFFPEGTRTADGAIGPFSRGAFRVAYDLGVPIQPVLIDGLDRVLPRHSIIAQRPRRERVRIRYLAPVHPPFGDGPRREAVRRLCDETRAVMVEELEKMRAGTPPEAPAGTPPEARSEARAG